MATNRNYVINFTDPGKDSFIIAPYTVDGLAHPYDNSAVGVAAHTTLYLPGKGKPDYGEKIAENLVHMLEHFAGSQAPNRPIEGQIWYDTSDVGVLRIYDSSDFISLSTVINFETAPSKPRTGHLWFDTTDQQLKVYDGGWVSVADQYLRRDGTVTLTANWDVGGYEIYGLPDPTSSSYSSTAATKGYVQSVVTGQITSLSLGDLDDVTTSSPANLDLIYFDSGSAEWLNGSPQLPYLNLDGSNQMQGDLDAGANNVVHLADPSNSDDAATKNYVDSQVSGVGDTHVDGVALTTSGTMPFDASGQVDVTTNAGDTYSTVSELALAGHEHYASEITFQSNDETVDDSLTRLDDEKAPKTNPLFDGSAVTIESGTSLVIQTEPSDPDEAATKGYVDANAGGSSAITRSLETSTGTTSFTTPEYVVATHKLWIFVNGQKYYASERGYQPVLFDSPVQPNTQSGLDPDTQGYQDVVLSPNVYDLDESTGLADDATTYTADVAINGNTALTLSIEGQNAQTYNELSDQVDTQLAGTPEVTDITTNADSGGSLNETWFSIYAPRAEVYVWYNVDDTGQDPNPLGYDGGVEVPISSGDTADTVASATAQAVGQVIAFSTSVSSNVVTVTNNEGGNIPDATDNNTGFSFSTTQQGLNGATAELTVGGDFRIISNIEGPSSTISITDTDLFSSLDQYDSIATAVAGTTTTYTVDIAIDGGAAQTVDVVGDDAQTLGEVIRHINADLTASHSAIINNQINVYSDAYGTGSTVNITSDDLFTHLSFFDQIGTAQEGFDEAYEEQGNAGETSTSVVFTDTIPTDAKVEFMVFQ